MEHTNYLCNNCANNITVAHNAAWPQKCPHCHIAAPVLCIKPTRGPTETYEDHQALCKCSPSWGVSLCDHCMDDCDFWKFGRYANRKEA